MFWTVYGFAVVLAAFILTVALIIVLRPVLERFALAKPNARSAHRTPTPQGGGLALVVATLGTSLAAFCALPAPIPAPSTELAAVSAATVLLAAVGLVDDVVSLGPGTRLVLQALAVAAVSIALAPDLRVLPQLPWWLERSVLWLAGMWFINLFNFMDGIDLMTVCETVPITLGLISIGALGGLRTDGVVLALALLGAIVGFAPFNRPVARLFLGDVGSLPVGLLVGWLLALVAGSGHLAAALLLPLYYVADATITLGRRALGGERVWEAHRSHFYQRAMLRGFTVYAVVGRVFLVNIGLALLASIAVAMPSPITDLGTLAAGLLLVCGLLLRLSLPP